MRYYPFLFLLVSLCLAAEEPPNSLDLVKTFLQESPGQAIADEVYGSLEKVRARILGPNLYLLSCKEQKSPIAGQIGEGELSPFLRITTINGILNDHDACIDNVFLLSSAHGNAAIHYVYRPSAGLGEDLKAGVHALMGAPSKTAALLAKRWKELIEEMGGTNAPGKIVHYAHSLGCVETDNARIFMTEVELKKIHIVSFGSPLVIPKKPYASVLNVISRRDLVCVLDFAAYIKARTSGLPHVRFVGTNWGLPDHLLGCDSYQEVVVELGERISDLYELDPYGERLIEVVLSDMMDTPVGR